MTPAGIPEPRVAEASSNKGGLTSGASPRVAVVMPVLNERRHLRAAIEAILGQDYAGEMEIVLALGPSTDGTDEVAAELAAADPRIHTVPNPTGATPSGLNAAIAATSAGIIV